MSFVRKLNQDEVQFKLIVEDETEPLESVFGSDIDYIDQEVLENIKNRIRRGDTWAWCSVEIQALWRGFVGKAYVGHCSYENEQDFIKNSGYYDEIVQESLDDLQDSVEETANKLSLLISIESMEKWICERVLEN